VPLRHGEGNKDHLTSFGGLAALSLDALAVLAAVLLIAVNAETARLIPLYAIGAFTGFTISQTGLVRHWYSQRTPRWLLHAALNGAGAILTATATAVFHRHQVHLRCLGGGPHRWRPSTARTDHWSTRSSTTSS